MSYDISTDGIRGDELMLFIKRGQDYLPIAYAKTHTLSLSSDSIDTSNKMDGNWKSSLAGKIGWSITSDCLISKTTGHLSAQTLAILMAKREPIELAIGIPKEGLEGEKFTYDSTNTWYTGSATITSLDQKADAGAMCESSITLEGQGALKDSTGTALDEVVLS